MRTDHAFDLADCTEYRQAVEARSPAIVHGTALLLITLLGVALAWSCLTRADLVVRASGRVRPVATTVKVFPAVRGEVLSASTGGRVAAVHFREGDRVLRGAVLIGLETTRLDNEIAKQRRSIQAGEEELTRLAHLQELAARQLEAARSKAEAELEQAQQEVHRASELRDAEIRLAEVALRAADAEEASLRRLVERRVAAPAELLKAATEARKARESLTKARLPVDEGRVAVLRRALEGVKRDDAIKQEELMLKREAKRAEVEAARIELASLELERQQAELRAPTDGIVTAGDVKVGDVLEPGKPVAEIARQAGFLFEAAVHRADRPEPRRRRPRSVPRAGQAGDGRAGGDRHRSRQPPVAPGQADSPDDQP
jgi:multidrug efflux pump subunit AcrA (membrane-fusion protein)